MKCCLKIHTDIINSKRIKIALKNSLIIIGVCLFVFGLSWHFIIIFQVGTIFLLNDICDLRKIMEAPPLGTATPRWIMEGACNWLPTAVLTSSASTSAGIVLTIGGFILLKKKQKSLKQG